MENRYVFQFHIIWDNHPKRPIEAHLKKTIAFLFYIINIAPADDLFTQIVTASACNVLT